MASEKAPPGRHTARAVGSGILGAIETTGTEYIDVKFVVQGGEHDGKVAYWRGFLSEAAAPRTVESLRHCGCTFPNQDVTDTTGIDTQDVRITVAENDRGYLEVKWINAARASGSPPVRGKVDKDRLRNRIRGLLATLSTEAPTPWSPSPDPEDDGGDIPF